eukprot:UN28545
MLDKTASSKPNISKSCRKEQRSCAKSTFFACFSKIPGVLILFDRQVKSQEIPEYLITRSKEQNQHSVEKDHNFFIVRQNSNPVQTWDVSPYAITVIKWSPNKKYFAVGDEMGYIRVFDFKEGKQTHIFKTFFGAINCLDWSNDSLYFVSGGQDDIVALWSIKNNCLVAIGEGHESWISDVCFEKSMMPNGVYRFISTSRD